MPKSAKRCKNLGLIFSTQKNRKTCQTEQKKDQKMCKKCLKLQQKKSFGDLQQQESAKKCQKVPKSSKKGPTSIKKGKYRVHFGKQKVPKGGIKGRRKKF